MEKEVLIIFPSEKQLVNLMSDFYKKFKIYVVLQKNSIKNENKYTNIIYISNNDEKAIELLQNIQLDVLCCHEEAIFWIKLHNSDNWNLQFNDLYLNLLEKHKFKKKVKNKIPISKYSLNYSELNNFPVIAKPSIGFGSIGVQYLSDYAECKTYKDNFYNMIKQSGIYPYQEKYFSEVNNICLFEEYLEGDFYRTPFIIRQGKCKYLFPILGITKLKKSISDYHWNEFEYSYSNSANRKKMINIIEILVDEFSLLDGFYVAEFIQKENNDVILLEFSPRKTSERIGHIIYLATGIDVEVEALNCFFDRHVKQEIIKNKCIRLRIERNKNYFLPLNDYRLIEEQEEYSVYNDKINSRYYIKKYI